MRFLAMIATFGMMVCANAMAMDLSASITPEGINVYSITKKGVELLRGSPYVLQQPGEPYPLTPARLAIGPDHEFLYVIYEQQPYHGDTGDDVLVVGLKITARGLVEQWSHAMNSDPLEYRYISLKVGAKSVIVYSRPYGLFADIYNLAGENIATDGSNGPSGDHLVSGSVAADNKFYYSCRASATAAAYVDVYSLTGKWDTQTLLLTSYDAAFVRSVCD